MSDSSTATPAPGSSIEPTEQQVQHANDGAATATEEAPAADPAAEESTDAAPSQDEEPVDEALLKYDIDVNQLQSSGFTAPKYGFLMQSLYSFPFSQMGSFVGFGGGDAVSQRRPLFASTFLLSQHSPQDLISQLQYVRFCLL
jgi:hypothetical protein